MGNQRNNKFSFGYTNNNQDATDLRKPEATEAVALDSDRLALGTLEASSYLTGSESSKGFGNAPNVVEVAGTEFQIQAGSAPRECEVFWKDDTGTFRAFGDTNVKIAPPTVTLTDGTAVVIESDDTVGSGSNSATLIPATNYTGPDSNQITVTVTEAVDPNDGQLEVAVSASVGTATIQGVGVMGDITKGTPFNVLIDGSTAKGIQVTLANVNDYVNGTLLVISVKVSELADGPYSYARLLKYSDRAQNNTEVRTPLGESVTVVLRNFDDAGNRISSLSPSIAVDSDPNGILEVYRSDDTTDGDFVRVFEDQSALPSDPFPDTTLISGLNPTVIATTDLDSETELSIAIGNADATNDYPFEKLFSFDSILWRVPKNRPDLLVYHDRNKILDWTRINNFSFEGSIVDIIELRDPTTVGGTLTKVVLTTNGIYNITGAGSANDPYVSSRIVPDINCESNSAVNANGTIILMSKSTDGGYDTGPYGQKVYEYDLQKVTEISQRVKNSDVITSNNSVEYAELRGGDKYLIKKTGVDNILLYHRDAQGWVTIRADREASQLWYWVSKVFTPPVLQRFKIEYSRKIKIDYFGILLIRFDVFTPESGGAATTISFNLPTAVGRRTVIQRLPRGLAQKWQFRVEALSPGSILYDWYFVD